MGRHWPWRLALLGLAAGAALLPVVVTNPYYLNIFCLVGLNAILVIGLNLLIVYAGQISLGHAALFGLGAYFSGILTGTYGLPPWPTILLAMALTGAVAYLIGRPILKLHGNYLVMATLGFNLIVNIVIIQWDHFTGGPSGLPGIPTLSLLGLAFDSDRRWSYLIWFFVLVGLILALNLVDSRVGRALRALHGSEVAAATLGVDVAAYKSRVFVLSALYASLAGSLYAHYLTFVSPKTFDIFFSVELVTMVIVGGMGSVWGSLLGALILTPLPQALGFVEDWKEVLYGGLLVACLIFAPQGLFVLASQAVARRWRARRREAR
jgi:branched-chain amino acid transport system permease protein